MNFKKPLSSKFTFYMQWPLITLLFLIILDIVLIIWVPKASLISIGFTIVYLLVSFIMLFIYKPSIMKEMVSFASQYAQVQQTLMDNFEIPYGLLDTSGRTIWMNKEMQTIFSKDKNYHKHISYLIKEFKSSTLPQGDETLIIETCLQERHYRVEIRRLMIEEWRSTTDVIIIPDDQTFLYTVCMYDITELKKYIKLNNDQKLVVALIYIDNYEEALEDSDDVRQSLLLALADRKINKYVSKYNGIVKKLEKDKYLTLLQNHDLTQMISDRFSLLEDIKTINAGNDVKLTVSIGIGMNGAYFPDNYTLAHAAIDFALGRGGDQAVINDNNQLSYFGGKSLSLEKNTRVRARVKAQALLEFINACDDLIIMGHKITDIDTFGAAIGIYRAAKHVGKRAYILIDKNSHSINPFLNLFFTNKDYEQDMFINHADADAIIDSHTILVVVDTNRPGNCEYAGLLEKAETIVVLDHHRQGSDVIKNATLSYIEPYASSSCEMVAEILQYFSDGIKLFPIEADCVYAGILVDTNNFLAKTGIRTFEAAAYLRRCGADISRVRKMMRSDIADFRARAAAVSHVQLYRDYYAISSLSSDGLISPTVVGAQAANELLSMVGIKASFILTEYNGIIYISARSIDEVNVQIIMERLGGGGHLNIAGAQLKDTTIDDAIQTLKDTIDKMIEEKAI